MTSEQPMANSWEDNKAERIAFRSSFPTEDELLQGLEGALGVAGGDLQVVSRQPNLYRSTFPSEVVTYRVGGDREVQAFCKYGVSGRYDAYEHRSGSETEARMYQRVLGPGGARPRLLGVYEGRGSEVWLILEYIAGALRIDRADPVPSPLVAAARWMGDFHLRNESVVPARVADFISPYSAAYYAGWAERTQAFAEPWFSEMPWLPSLCQRFADTAQSYLSPTATIIHGECTPHNVIAHDGEVYVIDWESAAIAPGEIDLVSLVEGWPAHEQEAAVQEYVRRRWPNGEPDELDVHIDAARVYWALRWLGERPDWTVRPKNRWRFEELRDAGARLGLA